MIVVTGNFVAESEITFDVNMVVNIKKNDIILCVLVKVLLMLVNVCKFKDTKL